MAQKRGEPLCIGDVGLTARHLRYVPRIDDPEVNVSLKQSVDRHPVDAGTLHCDVGDVEGLQPSTQILNVALHCAKCTNHLLRLTSGRALQHASHHSRPMDIESTAAFDNDFH